MPEDWARPVVHWEIRARDPERAREAMDAHLSHAVATWDELLTNSDKAAGSN